MGLEPGLEPGLELGLAVLQVLTGGFFSRPWCRGRYEKHFCPCWQCFLKMCSGSILVLIKAP